MSLEVTMVKSRTDRRIGRLIDTFRASLAITSVFSACFLLACSEKPSEAPRDCSSPEAEAIAVDLFHQSITDFSAALKRTDLVEITPATIELVRTLAVDEKLKKSSCAGVLQVKPPARLIRYFEKMNLHTEKDFKMHIRDMEIDSRAGTMSVPVEYNVQRTDDGTALVVELQNHKELARLIINLVAMIG